MSDSPLKDITYHDLVKSIEDKTLDKLCKDSLSIFDECFLDDMYSTEGVYFLIDSNSEKKIVYVGRSKSLMRRLLDHKNNGKVFNRFAFVKTKLEETGDIEAIFIRLFKPKYNDRVPDLLAEKKTQEYMGLSNINRIREFYNPNDYYVHDPDYHDKDKELDL